MFNIHVHVHVNKIKDIPQKLRLHYYLTHTQHLYCVHSIKLWIFYISVVWQQNVATNLIVNRSTPVYKTVTL